MNSSGGKLRTGRPRVALSTFSKTMLWMGVASATVIGCSWAGTQHSVRFNGFQSEREMGRLPPMPTRANGLNDLRVVWEMEDGGGDDYESEERRVQEVDELWDRASAAEKDGDLRLDRERLRQYLEQTAIARGSWFSPKDRQLRRNSAIDRLDALRALDRGSSVARVRAYLDARRSFDVDKPSAEELAKVLEPLGGDPNLRDNVAYLKAAVVYKQADYAEAAKAFSALARRYPHSEKREVAIFMSGVALMKTSAFGPNDETEPGDSDGAVTPPKSELDPDEAWHAAVALFKKLIKENPHGRFVNDARGWLAHLLLHGHDRASALVEYYRMMGNKHDENARIEAAFSLQLHSRENRTQLSLTLITISITTRLIRAPFSHLMMTRESEITKAISTTKGSKPDTKNGRSSGGTNER
jgi:TolA-binding protein